MTNKLALVFPGQGSQSKGMLDVFTEDYKDIVDAACQEASDVLGYDMAQLIALDPEQRLDQTMYTQPALLTAGVIAWRVWQQECELQPQFLAGHSLGEYTALVCAEALSFADGLRLVATRGQLMQEAVPAGTGAMAAVLGLDLQQLQDICANIGLNSVSPANLNAPGQIVLAGAKAAVEQAIEQAKAAGAKRAIMLPVSVPSHCSLMRPAAEKLAATLDAIEWRAPKVAIVQNFDVQIHSDGKQICAALQQQLFSPVRWIETIEYFVSQGVTEIVECGPGKVLTGLNKRIAPEITTRAITENIGAGVC